MLFGLMLAGLAAKTFQVVPKVLAKIDDALAVAAGAKSDTQQYVARVEVCGSIEELEKITASKDLCAAMGKARALKNARVVPCCDGCGAIKGAVEFQ